MSTPGVHGCGCGHQTLGPLGTPKVVDGIEHRWGRFCRPVREKDNDTTPPDMASERSTNRQGNTR